MYFRLLRLGADRLQHAQVRQVRRQHERHAGPAEFLVDRGHGAGRQVVTAEVLGRVEAPQSQILRDRPQPLLLLDSQFRMIGARQLGLQVMRLERDQLAVDEFRDRLADHRGLFIAAHR